jgi:hypothetical protein
MGQSIAGWGRDCVMDVVTVVEVLIAMVVDAVVLIDAVLM